MNDVVERIDHESGAIIRIFQDDSTEMPRGAWQTCIGTIADWHRRDDVGDTRHGDRKVTETELDALKRGGWPLLKRYLRMTEGATNVLPIGLLDHSGWHVYIGGGEHACDPGGWDSGTVGFIYDTAESRAITGCEGVHVEEALRQEIEELDQYFTGDVYFYTVEFGGEMIDSCGGFYGFEYVKEAATENVQACIDQTRAEWISCLTESVA